MRYEWAEEALEVWFPLSNLVCSYSCPAVDAMAKTAAVPSSDPSADLLWVLDMGLIFDTLPEPCREVLMCIYGLGMSIRGTARKLNSHPQRVKRNKMQGLAIMTREMRRKGVGLTLRQRLKYC